MAGDLTCPINDEGGGDCGDCNKETKGGRVNGRVPKSPKVRSWVIVAANYTEPENMACAWFGEICSCALNNSRDKFHECTYKPYI